VRTADENMANEIRLIAVERGLDARTFALIAFGGAGPLHARAVAERLGMTTVIIPPHPGLCSAFGAAIAEARIDRMQTFFTRSEDIDIDAFAATLRRLRDGAVEELKLSVDVEAPVLRSSVDMRYSGQNYEVEVPLAAGEFTGNAWAELVESFTSTHSQLYGFSLPGEPMEIINIRVTAISPEPPQSFSDAGGGEPPPVAQRKVWFEGAPADCAIYNRAGLKQNAVIAGPAVIEEMDSTTLVFPGDELRVGAAGVMTLTLGKST
jgi:N-methylhydantoinase A